MLPLPAPSAPKPRATRRGGPPDRPRTDESPACDCGSEYVETEAPTLRLGHAVDAAAEQDVDLVVLVPAATLQLGESDTTRSAAAGLAAARKADGRA